MIAVLRYLLTVTYLCLESSVTEAGSQYYMYYSTIRVENLVHWRKFCICNGYKEIYNKKDILYDLAVSECK